MTLAVKNLLISFDHLEEKEKQEAIALILKRSLDLNLLPLTDEELILSGEGLFLELDKREATDA
jgi:hypothetical protein